jgi:hypothetical protein
MKLLIEIPEKTYHMINTGSYDYGDMNVIIQNGIPLEQYEYRKKMFSYLDGIADGLNESSRDTIDVLDKIKAEIKELPYQRLFGNVSSYSLLDTVIEIIDKYRNEVNDGHMD